MDEAANQPLPEEEQQPHLLATQLAELVRSHTKDSGKLLCLEKIRVDDQPLEPEQWEGLIEELGTMDGCGDLKVIRSSAGSGYLYSATHMSDSYARILLRLEDGAPYELIAGTVREDSHTYPRPTPVTLFKNPPFRLEIDQVETLVAEMGQIEEYRDIRMLTASTGAHYLFSAKHLDEDWAASLVEWLEVGWRQSP